MSDSDPKPLEDYFEKPKEPKVARQVIGNVLHLRRKAAKLTLKMAADQLNISLTTVQRTEKGQRNISFNDVVAMSVVYGCTTKDVMDEVDRLMRKRRQN